MASDRQGRRKRLTCTWIWSRVKRRTQIVRETEKSDEGVKFRRSNQLGQRSEEDEVWASYVQLCKLWVSDDPDPEQIKLLMSNDPHDILPRPCSLGLIWLISHTFSTN